MIWDDYLSFVKSEPVYPGPDAPRMKFPTDWSVGVKYPQLPGSLLSCVDSCEPSEEEIAGGLMKEVQADYDRKFVAAMVAAMEAPSETVTTSPGVTAKAFVEVRDMLRMLQTPTTPPPLPDAGEIVLTENAVEQFRFPRSKRKRIRNKWAKRPENFRPPPKTVWVDPRGRIYCHPKSPILKQLRTYVDNECARKI